MEAALEYARQNFGPNYYVEHGTPVDLMQANYELENQLQEEEVRKLKELTKILEERAASRFYEIQELQIKWAEKEEEMAQIMESNNDYLMRIAKHMKTDIPYRNRSFECLSVRLKMLQFTCLTLQPLF